MAVLSGAPDSYPANKTSIEDKQNVSDDLWAGLLGNDSWWQVEQIRR